MCQILQELLTRLKNKYKMAKITLDWYKNKAYVFPTAGNGFAHTWGLWLTTDESDANLIKRFTLTLTYNTITFGGKRKTEILLSLIVQFGEHGDATPLNIGKAACEQGNLNPEQVVEKAQKWALSIINKNFKYKTQL